MIEGRANVSDIKLISFYSYELVSHLSTNQFSFQELPDFQVFQTVVKYCLFIIIVPVSSFFVVKSIIFDGLLGLEPMNSSVYSAVIAVIVLHVTLALYIYRAYNETEKAPTKPVKKD